MKTNFLLKWIILVVLFVSINNPSFTQIPGLKKLEKEAKKVENQVEEKIKKDNEKKKTEESSSTTQSQTTATTSSQIIYVSASKGNNKNDGSINSPLKEIIKQYS